MGVVTADNSFYPTPGTVPVWAQPVPDMNAFTVAIAADPGANSRKGFFVIHHPAANVDSQTQPPTVPNVPTAEALQTLANNAAAQGWLAAYPILCTDRSTYGSTGTNLNSMATLVTGDTTHGTVLVSAECARDDKLYSYLCKKYAIASAPVIHFGFSLGAWTAAKIALNRSRVIGLGMHALPTIFANLQLGVPPGTLTNPLASTTNTGLDLASTALNGLSIPMILGWSTADGTVGWNGSSTPVSNVAAILAANPAITSYQSTSDGTYPDGHIIVTGDVNEYGTTWLSSSAFSSYSPFF